MGNPFKSSILLIKKSLLSPLVWNICKTKTFTSGLRKSRVDNKRISIDKYDINARKSFKKLLEASESKPNVNEVRDSLDNLNILKTEPHEKETLMEELKPK